MRSEYLGACALIEGLADAINAGMFLTPRMTRDHCREAIVGPAAVCDIDIEPALVNRCSTTSPISRPGTSTTTPTSSTV